MPSGARFGRCKHTRLCAYSWPPIPNTGPCAIVLHLPSLAKTEIMVVHSHGTRLRPAEIRFGGVQLREVKVFKYLGFLVAPDLSFTAHVTRAATWAKAASSTIGRLIRFLNIRSLSRMGTYLSFYVESQFYCSELLPPSLIGDFNSARLHFVRTVFDLPASTSHELATILFDLSPVELLLLQRRRSFLSGLRHHDFHFVWDACSIDAQLLTYPKSWSSGLVRLILTFDPDFSTTDFCPSAALDHVLSSVGNRSMFNFYFIKHGDSISLSFF